MNTLFLNQIGHACNKASSSVKIEYVQLEGGIVSDYERAIANNGFILVNK